MNDPHVVALHYAVIVGSDCDFDKAPPLKHQEAAFDVEVAGRDATFTMKQHFATADDACSVVQPFVDAWNVTSGLDRHPSAFRLEFVRADLIDRAPAPRVLQADVGIYSATGVDMTPRVGYSSFPLPPTNFNVSPEAQAMYWQHEGYKQGKIPLPHMCYFLLTILKENSDRQSSSITEAKNVRKQRREPSAKWKIAPKLLKEVGRLSTKKGGPLARKAEGLHAKLTEAEHAWLEAVAKMMIRRAGEVAANPAGAHRELTFDDLPPL